MASNSRKTTAKRRARLYRAGRKRKNEGARKSTLSYEELFAGFGAPGEPAPKQ
ncbi:MAG: hypothetical protein JRH20_00705 [Deltaproteobacteria bacterium]|nr:hypothetical protein [Deltaproteobacteria bacterium]